MATIYSTFDHTLKIPPYFKNLTKKDPFVQEFKAFEPVEVPNHIAEYYTKNWGNKYRYADEEQLEDIFEEGNPEEYENTNEEFNALDFLSENDENIEEAIEGLEKKEEIHAIAKFLRLNSYHKQKNERIKERIIEDIKAKKKQQELLDKGGSK